ncbi:MAG: hypothetical protein O2807_03950 [bacterium]|nr:hypothetical protein [bacterium]
MRPRAFNIFVIVLLLLAAGCAAKVRDVSIQLLYTPDKDVSGVRSPVKTVALGILIDSRSERAGGPVGERNRIGGGIDRYSTKGDLPSHISNVIKGYYTKRNVRVLDSRWDGTPAQLWDQKGEIVLSGRIHKMWFTSKDTVAYVDARNVFWIEIIAGSPTSGTIIKKRIQLEPKRTSSVFWNEKDVEAWLSRTVSDAIERVLPDLERRLAG